VELRRNVERRVQKYEFFRYCWDRGDGLHLPRLIQRMEKVCRDAARLAQEIEEEPGHLWSFMTAETGVDSDRQLQRFTDLADFCNEMLARAKPGKGNSRDTFCDDLLSDLQAVFRAAGGGRTGVTRDADGKRTGRFLKFCAAAMAGLPEKYRPQSLDALGARWERICKERKEGCVKRRSWLGGPSPLAGVK
jgi:hypothetical protein